MNGLALMEVQRALYAKLQADGVLMGMVGGVYDTVPQDAALPYVVIGDGRQNVLETDDLAATDCRLELDVWTETGGRKQALTILNRIHALLHLGTLTLSGYELVLLRSQQGETIMSERGSRIHGMLAVIATLAEV